MRVFTYLEESLRVTLSAFKKIKEIKEQGKGEIGKERRGGGKETRETSMVMLYVTSSLSSMDHHQRYNRIHRERNSFS